MTSLFCCASAKPYRPQHLEHESKFKSFMNWAEFPQATSSDGRSDEARFASVDPSFAVQLVRQVNYGPLESKRYFIPVGGGSSDFVEITEEDLITANFEKLNSYKNWKCDTHNKFFETNLYQKNAINKHHWRVNIARPAGDIDL